MNKVSGSMKALKIVLVAIALCAPLCLFAQTGFSDTDVTDTPIDGGISLLVAAGIGLGAKKLHAMRKQRQADNNTDI